MVTIHIPDELARQLENQAEQANQSLEEYAVNLLQKNLTPQADDDDEVPEGEHPLDAILGMFDDDVTGYVINSSGNPERNLHAEIWPT